MESESVVSSAYVRHMLSRCGQTFTDADWQRMWDQQPYETKVTLLEMREEQYARMTGVELTDKETSSTNNNEGD